MTSISHEPSKSPKNHILTNPNWDNAVRWNPGERLHHLFEERCDRFERDGQSEHLAVDSLEGRWTFGQLDQRANQLARYLRSRGLASGDVIGLLFDKSVHSYMAMLAVSKINAAYVPLDPAFPMDRIAFICEDAGVKAIVSVEAFAPLTKESGLVPICVDTDAAAISQYENTRLNEEESGKVVSELCYIIYTSGSTGRPKGVPIEQASICNFIRVAVEVYGYEPSDRVYQGLTIAFDFAVEEIWVPLIAGATLVPNRTGSSLLGHDLARFVVENKITAMCCVPTLLATIEEDLPAVRLLIVSGEACPRDLIMRWSSPGRVILNAYGPTETTVTATLAFSRPDEAVTIGKPLPTYSVIILEPGTEKVLPFGEEGEIAVAGVGVAKGYLNREEKTREVFIPDFLKIENNLSGLIYRTGDLGFINPNGDIEYRGRIDLQVKIRGYRIELTEIESVILQCPGVAQAVVETFEPMPEVKELVAYYTLKKGAELSRETLVASLREKLPGYMVPTYYEKLDAIPMMASDKADRKALPRPSGRRMNTGNAELVAPRTKTEREIAEVLARVLRIEAVSVEDHFFDNLGANSLLMTQFGAALRRHLPEVDLSIREFYSMPTVAKLAAHLDGKKQGKPVSRPEIKVDEFRIPTKREYYTCGALQFLTWVGMALLIRWVLLDILPWILAAPTMIGAAWRMAGLTALWLPGWTVLSVVAKWILVGKMQAGKIPIWSFAYFRFWLYKKIVLFCPLTRFPGTPLYNFYLRLLGAKIGRNVVLHCKTFPWCSDLLEVGDNTILRFGSLIPTYKARSNYLYFGPVKIGSNVTVGAGSLLDIHTVMEDGSQLGHASCLAEGQVAAPGKRYHGNPAEETDTDFRVNCDLPISKHRGIIYSLALLAATTVGTAALAFVFEILEFQLDYFGQPFSAAWAGKVTLFAAVWAPLLLLLGLGLHMGVPRMLNRLIVPGRSYPRYGFHYFIFSLIRVLSNSRMLNTVMGDSSFIVYYLKLIGYKLDRVVQTGSNFGQSQTHDNPVLCSIGTRTLVSDGLAMGNIHESCSGFRLAEARVGADCFMGNHVYIPPGSRAGNNCLIATKAMMPIDGAMRENVGLLGSPSFEIPRTTGTYGDLDPFTQHTLREEGLRKKNRHNLVAIFAVLFFYLFFFCFGLIMTGGVVHLHLISPGAITIPGWLTYSAGLLIFTVSFTALVERGSYRFGRMRAVEVSIYDREFWRTERFWKFSENILRSLWVGTPFRSIINWFLGIKLGKMVFDDGAAITEKTLITIGDYCNLNTHCVLQGHSLENCVYKSGPIVIGDRCSIDPEAWVHYSVTAGNDVVITADSFVMKGEQLADRSVWGGNPARETGFRL